jgi:hypothetical protein
MVLLGKMKRKSIISEVCFPLVVDFFGRNFLLEVCGKMCYSREKTTTVSRPWPSFCFLIILMVPVFFHGMNVYVHYNLRRVTETFQ